MNLATERTEKFGNFKGTRSIDKMFVNTDMHLGMELIHVQARLRGWGAVARPELLNQMPRFDNICVKLVQQIFQDFFL